MYTQVLDRPFSGQTTVARASSAGFGPPSHAGSSPDTRLVGHLVGRLGVWPAASPLDIVVWPGRGVPAWDGGVWPALGVESPAGTVLSLAPGSFGDATSIDRDVVRTALRSSDRADLVPAALGRPDLHFGEAVFRWGERVVALSEIGEWIAANDRRSPNWVRPFGGDVLVAWSDQGTVAAGVGLKRHDRFAVELAVGTEPAHRGKRLARALVAQASRKLLDQDILPLYLHEAGNAASARVAEAAGFPDQGWRIFWLAPSSSTP